MSITEFKNNLLEIKDSVINIQATDKITDGATYQALQNHLLILIYTSYEKYIKGVIEKLSKNKDDYLLLAIFAEHRSVNSKYWTPKLRKENMEKNFVLLKDWSQYDNISKYLDTIVNERNNYAHMGITSISFEQLIMGIQALMLLISFIFLFYELPLENLNKNFFKEEEIRELLINEKELLKYFETKIKILKQYGNKSNNLPNKLRRKLGFFELKKQIKIFLRKHNNFYLCNYTGYFSLLKHINDIESFNKATVQDNIKLFSSLLSNYNELTYGIKLEENQLHEQFANDEQKIVEYFKMLDERLDKLVQLDNFECEVMHDYNQNNQCKVLINYLDREEVEDRELLESIKELSKNSIKKVIRLLTDDEYLEVTKRSPLTRKLKE